MKRNKKGFTIVELVIVIAIIAILAAVMLPTFSNVITKAEESAALQKLNGAYMEALTQALLDRGMIDTSQTFTAGGFEFEFTTSDGANANIKVPADFGYSASVKDGKVVLGEAGSGNPEPDETFEVGDYKVFLYLTNVAEWEKSEYSYVFAPDEGYMIDPSCVKIIIGGEEKDTEYIETIFWPETDAVYLYLDDEDITADTIIEVKAQLKPEPTGPVEVGTADALASALASGGEVKLMTDNICIGDVVISETTELDLNGHTLIVEGGIKVGNRAEFTVKSSGSCSTINLSGNIHGGMRVTLTVENVDLKFDPGFGIFVEEYGTVTIEKSTITTSDACAVNSFGAATTIRNSVISNTNSNDNTYPKSAIQVSEKGTLILDRVTVSSDVTCVAVSSMCTAEIQGGVYTCNDTFTGNSQSFALNLNILATTTLSGDVKIVTENGAEPINTAQGCPSGPVIINGSYLADMSHYKVLKTALQKFEAAKADDLNDNVIDGLINTFPVSRYHEGYDFIDGKPTFTYTKDGVTVKIVGDDWTITTTE